MSDGRNTIIVQYVNTYKIEILDNDLIVILIFHTAINIIPMIEGHTRCVNQD